MPQERAVRFTVSLPARLMRTLDRLRAGRRYGNRSEFVRDLLRGELVKEEWAEQKGETVAVVLLVYDHHTRLLADKLTDIQHHSFADIAAALHIHLDEHGVAWIDNTKVKVIEVVLDKLAHGSSPEEIHFQYPHLSLAQIHAALAYYYDHQVELDAEIQRCWQAVNKKCARNSAIC